MSTSTATANGIVAQQLCVNFEMFVGHLLLLLLLLLFFFAFLLLLFFCLLLFLHKNFSLLGSMHFVSALRSVVKAWGKGSRVVVLEVGW